jgi:hypothetical protein
VPVVGAGGTKQEADIGGGVLARGPEGVGSGAWAGELVGGPGVGASVRSHCSAGVERRQKGGGVRVRGSKNHRQLLPKRGHEDLYKRRRRRKAKDETVARL